VISRFSNYKSLDLQRQPDSVKPQLQGGGEATKIVAGVSTGGQWSLGVGGIYFS
jgi:hypothetical protein